LQHYKFLPVPGTQVKKVEKTMKKRKVKDIDKYRCVLKEVE